MLVVIAIGLSYFGWPAIVGRQCCAIQVRSTGPVNALTHQPIKGRKFGGGIRFGEMERDALLAHGSAYLLHDRLHTSSDYAVLDACQSCGSILAPITQPRETSALGPHLTNPSGHPSQSTALCVRALGHGNSACCLPYCSARPDRRMHRSGDCHPSRLEHMQYTVT